MTHHTHRVWLLTGALLCASLASTTGCSNAAPAQDAASEPPPVEPTATPASLVTPRPMPVGADMVLPGITDHELVITYIGDTGFIIESGDTRIALNAFFEFDWCIDAPTHHQSLMIAAQPPFDDIDIILATSDHGNNFDLRLVGDYLEDHPDTVFISTTDVTGPLRTAFLDLEGRDERVMGFSLTGQQREQVTVHGVDLEIMAMPHHGSYSNLGFLISLGGYTLFHPGNLWGDSPEEVIQILQDYQIHDRGIDVAFVPFFYLIPPEDAFPQLAGESDLIIAEEGIEADLIIPMYFWCVWPDFLARWDAEAARAAFPNIVLFDEELQTLTIESAFPEP